ncbi:MAG TPA: O-antigen ligase family protein [Thermoanaerobaculia bacterium]|nr:O-antigen ligase family protein [Thermoanaerobaculia bacterium]
MKARRPVAAAPASVREPLDLRLGMFALWLLVLVPPFLVYRVAKESFRQPKLLVSEWLALASLVVLVWGLRRVGEVRLGDLWRSPAIRIVLPVLVVATAGLATTEHPLHTREALADLWIGAACLVGWSLALSALRLERLLAGLLIPAALLSVFGVLQYHDLWQPLRFFGIETGSRLALTSLAGNPGDLGAYLVLPCLTGQWLLVRRLREGDRTSPAFWGTAGALALCLYVWVLTQTLAALAALFGASLLFWMILLPRRRSAPVLASLAAGVALLVLAVAPLRERIVDKARQAAAGDLNAVLTNRLDAWRAGAWMLREQPLTGVGHGAYRPEYVPAKLALLDRGVEFSTNIDQPVFANAHNEFVEVGAEWGMPGLVALGWGLWVLLASLGRISSPDRALAWAGTAALFILSLAHFPFRIALVAFPALLFLSWALRRSAEDGAA